MLTRRARTYSLAASDPSHGKSKQDSFDRFPRSMRGGFARWLSSKHDSLKLRLCLRQRRLIAV